MTCRAEQRSGPDAFFCALCRSVVDWLAEDKGSGWHVDVRVGHAVHAAVWGRKVEAAGVGGRSGTLVETLGAYPSVYTLHHAEEAGELDVVAMVCTSLGYVRACAEAGEMQRLVRDVARAVQALTTASHPKAALAQETRAWLRLAAVGMGDMLVHGAICA